MTIEHRSGLVIEDEVVLHNLVFLEEAELPGSTKFTAEDGDTYSLNQLRDHYVGNAGIIHVTDSRWEMKSYNISHQTLGPIGIAALRLYRPEHSMGIDSDVEFAVFGHVELDEDFRRTGLGVPTYVAAQTSLPERYRLARTNNAKLRAQATWESLYHHKLVDMSTVVAVPTNGVVPARTFLKDLESA